MHMTRITVVINRHRALERLRFIAAPSHDLISGSMSKDRGNPSANQFIRLRMKFFGVQP
ncbi:hypothetical protein D3C76_1723730 [compost metagenome]